MLRSAAASWTLFFGLLLIMAGNGLQMVLLGIRSTDAGFSNVATGLIMAGYYLGLFLGSLGVPHILKNVGHVRVFGAMSAVASAAVLVHAAIVDPYVWAFMRILTGFSFAGMYIVCESWLNDQSTNETRGQMLSFMIVTMAGIAGGQLMISLDSETGVELFLLASVLVSLAVVPILISVGKAPEFSAPERTACADLPDFATCRYRPCAERHVNRDGLRHGRGLWQVNWYEQQRDRLFHDSPGDRRDAAAISGGPAVGPV